MQRLIHPKTRLSILAFLAVSSSLILVLHQSTASAVQNPQSGSFGIEGTITSSPPSTPPTISIPTNGQSFRSEPVTISGLCSSDLLVRLFSNNVFIGAAQCTDDSYTITAGLFDGQNQLTAIEYDALNQNSPTSAVTAVAFNSGATTNTPQLLLTSAYAERGATPGSILSWPISVSGGVPPYAISIDWGDASSADLISQALAGTFTGQHTYNQAGVYNILIKATDQNGSVAYLQLVGIGNGTVAAGSLSGTSNTSTLVRAKAAWWPTAVAVPFIIVSFWLGGRQQLVALRQKMEHSSEEAQNE